MYCHFFLKSIGSTKDTKDHRMEETEQNIGKIITLCLIEAELCSF